MSVKLRIQGLERLEAALKKMPPRVWKAFERGLIREAQGVVTEAQQRVPVVSGRLRSSAFVRKEKRNQYRADVSVGYAAPYAIYVHEIPYSGKTTKGQPGAERNGKGYKWLEKASRKALKGARVRLINAIRAALKRR